MGWLDDFFGVALRLAGTAKGLLGGPTGGALNLSSAFTAVWNPATLAWDVGVATDGGSLGKREARIMVPVDWAAGGVFRAEVLCNRTGAAITIDSLVVNSPASISPSGGGDTVYVKVKTKVQSASSASWADVLVRDTSTVGFTDGVDDVTSAAIAVASNEAVQIQISTSTGAVAAGFTAAIWYH